MATLSADGAGGTERAGASVALPEEKVCLQIVDNAESWLMTTKRIMQGNSFTSSEISKGTLLDTIRELFREGKSIPLNLDYEMRPLRAALRDAREWIQKHEGLLVLLGIRKDSINAATRSTSISAYSNSSGNNSSNSGSSSSASADQSTYAGAESHGEDDDRLLSKTEGISKNEDDSVTYEQLFSCVSAGAHLSADFNELR